MDLGQNARLVASFDSNPLYVRKCFAKYEQGLLAICLGSLFITMETNSTG